MNATPEFSPNECQFCRTWHTPTVPLKLFCSEECTVAHRAVMMLADTTAVENTVFARMQEAVAQDIDDMFWVGERRR